MSEQRIRELEFKRDQYVNRLTLMLLEITVVLGVPAGIAAYVGKKIIGSTETTILLLAIALVLSWAYIIYRHQKLSREVSAIEYELKTLKAKENPKKE